MSTLTQTITHLEDATWTAMQSHGAALLPYLHPSCTLLFPMGLKVTSTTSPSLHEVLTSDAFVPWKSYAMDDISVLEIGTGNQAAVITYEVRALRPALSEDGREETFRALVSSTWTVDGQGKWLLLVSQQTPFDRNMAEDEAVGL
jgi:hypothetical protein